MVKISVKRFTRNEPTIGEVSTSPDTEVPPQRKSRSRKVKEAPVISEVIEEETIREEPQETHVEEDESFINEMKELQVNAVPPPIEMPLPEENMEVPVSNYAASILESFKSTGRKKRTSLPKKNRDQVAGYKDLFSEEATPHLGVQRRALLNKITQMKQLFPAELGSFRIKEGASDEQLKTSIQEMESILDTTGVEAFIVDVILASIKGVERMTASTRFDLRGLSKALSANPQFSLLCKRCVVKYGVFTQVPPEQQLLLIVVSTAIVVQSTNARKRQLGPLLDQTIDEED